MANAAKPSGAGSATGCTATTLLTGVPSAVGDDIAASPYIFDGPSLWRAIAMSFYPADANFQRRGVG
jgi:hypothetical protein